MASINGRDEFTFHTQLRSDERPNQISVAQAQGMFQAALGAEWDVEIVARSTWNAGYTLVAEKFRSGRVFLCGDAAHLFTPTGGLGYEDAVNIGWKLAAVLKGWGGPTLLESYEIERQALARRNTKYARAFADSVGLYVPPVELEDDTEAGRAARKIASDHFDYHARFEFNIPGITFGGRYDGSPIVVADSTAPPPDKPNEYVPTGCPGGRAPHLWLDDEYSLYDMFGFEFTLLRLGANSPDATPIHAAARTKRLPLKILDLTTEQARDLYGADLALVRPDQIVAWRGNVVADAVNALRQVSGHK